MFKCDFIFIKKITIYRNLTLTIPVFLFLTYYQDPDPHSFSKLDPESHSDKKLDLDLQVNRIRNTVLNKCVRM
jgi:hypothetical protein